VLLPEGFPGEWNYWVGRRLGVAAPQTARGSSISSGCNSRCGVRTAFAAKPGSYGVEVEWIVLGF